MAQQAVLKLVADNSQLTSKLQQSTKEIKRLEKQVKASQKGMGKPFDGLKHSAMSSIGPMAGVAAGMASVGGAADFIKESVTETRNLALETSRLATQTGMDAEQSSAWISLAKERGIQAAKLQLNFRTLSRQILGANSGTKSSAELFTRLGVSQQALKSQNFPAVIGGVAQAFSRMKDGAEKTAIAQKLFGRAGSQLIPILNKGKVGLREQLAEMKKLHLTINGQTLDSASKLKVGLRELNGRFEGLKVAIGTKIIPVLAQLMPHLTSFIDAVFQGGKGLGGSLHNALVSAGHALQTMWTQLKPVVKGMADLIAKHPGLLGVLAAFMAFMKVASMIRAVTAAFAAFNIVLELNPIVFIATAIVAAAFLVITHWKRVKGVLAAVWNWIKGAFRSVANVIVTVARSGFLGPAAWIISRWRQVGSFLRGLFGGIVGFLGGMIGRLGGLASRIGSAIYNGILGVLRGLGGAISGALSGIGSGLAGVINSAIDVVNSGISKINSVASKIPGVGTIGPIPHLASGGIVTRPTIALIGEAGPEAVVPLSRGRAGDRARVLRQSGGLGAVEYVFNIYNQGTPLDESALAAKIGWQLASRGVSA